MLGTDTNCNFCKDACALANSESHCTQMGAGYVCNLVQCNPGFADCDGIASNGCEVNLNNDANNCGNCGNACTSGPNSTAVCTNAVCGLSCSPGHLNCNEPPSQGCPINGQIDPMNCGACAHVCVTPKGISSCTAGMCMIAMCDTGYADCNKVVSDGCEVDTLTDPKNCGFCANVCAMGATCVAGMCQ
jgi:hypothetical protein